VAVAAQEGSADRAKTVANKIKFFKKLFLALFFMKQSPFIFLRFTY
jgi:hypothetical protein